MGYEIVTGTVESRPMAAVRRRVPVGDVAAVWRPALDQVWAFLRRHEGLRTDGHNIFVYRQPAEPGAPMEVDFGVEVSRPFDAADEVVFTRTPAGEVAWTRHLGPVDRLGDAYAAIEEWCRAHGRAPGGVSWEIYGDPGDDPSVFEITAFWLLAG